MLNMGEREFIRIVSFVRDNYGINLEKKRALVQGRLAFDIERRGYTSFAEYFDSVISHPTGTECQHMINRLSTNHTYFFREPGCFEHMRDVAVPSLINRGVKNISIWCAASSTGQECYSAAMVIDEALSPYANITYSILGSDVNVEVLNTAKAGIYDISELTNIPAKYQRCYCRMHDEENFEICESLKERIAFSRINLVKPLSALRGFHIIFCRNVMIYFEPATKDILTGELYNLVKDGGFIYVGSTETLDIKRTRFKYIKPSVFEKHNAQIGI